MNEPERCKECNVILNVVNTTGYCRICYRESTQWKKHRKEYHKQRYKNKNDKDKKQKKNL